eukprot:1010007-Prymnesium_polylepis.1
MISVSVKPCSTASCTATAASISRGGGSSGQRDGCTACHSSSCSLYHHVQPRAPGYRHSDSVACSGCGRWSRAHFHLPLRDASKHAPTAVRNVMSLRCISRGMRSSVQRGAGTSADAGGASAQSVSGGTFAGGNASVANCSRTSGSSLRKLLLVGAARSDGRAAAASALSACGFAEPTCRPKLRIVRTHASVRCAFIAAGYTAAAADRHLPSSSLPRACLACFACVHVSSPRTDRNGSRSTEYRSVVHF